MQSRTGDVESGPPAPAGDASCPGMLESPQLRWAFVRKVYAILLSQLLLTAGVAAAVALVKPVSRFIAETWPGSMVVLVLVVLVFILMRALSSHHKRYPVNFVLLGLYTVTLAFMVGLACAFMEEKIILESAILTSVAIVALTCYTFWAVKRGRDFSFLAPFLFASLLVLLVFTLIQIFFPLGKLSTMIHGCLGAIVFAAYIVYDTGNLIKRLSYDEYIWAAVALYLDVLNLFLSFINIFGSADC
ncbi:protein LIFEGUARD 4-like [Syzygium oleosum]|uniref:protein LIFEGUARD 4-like n=1 Tax=Syzygium oleosum TaxID=219896 RepID=UPI0011D1A392|nr:protein LIFEGUARD 4-like [Syzygium oleosum]